MVYNYNPTKDRDRTEIERRIAEYARRQEEYEAERKSLFDPPIRHEPAGDVAELSEEGRKT